MSDTNMHVGIGLEVETRNTDDIRKLESKLKSLEALAKSIASSIRTAATVNPSSNAGKAGRATDPAKAIRAEQAAQARAFRAQFGFNSRMHKQAEAEARRQSQGDEKAFRLRMAWNDRMYRQRAAEQKRADQAEAASRARQDRETERAFRRSLAFNTRIADQRARQEAATSRDQERADLNRARAEAFRKRQAEIAERRADRDDAANRRDVVRHGRSTANHAHDAYTRIARPITTGAAVAAGAGALAARTGISARIETDTAETNLKIFSEQTADQIKSARRGWLDAEAIKHGQSIAAGLNAYGEVLKAGIKSPVENTKMLMGAVSALELDLAQTTKLAGLIDRNYGSASNPAKLKSAMNAIAVAAREDPTQAPEIVEGMKRGFGVLSMGNMSPEELAAFVSGGQSVGIQPGKAGTFIATLGKQLSSGANKFLDPKNRKELNFAARHLGFGNAKAMADAFKTDSAGTILKTLEGLKAADPTLRTSIASALSGNQWNDEDLQIVNGLDGLKNTLKAIKDPANASFLDDAARKRQDSWLGQWNSTRAIINRFWESFGAGFDEILTSFNKTFMDASSRFDFDRVTEIVRQGLAGVKDALGIREWREFFSGAIGGNLAGIGQQVRDFAKGFTEGVMSIVRVIRSVFSTFAGADASTETIGRWTGSIIALAAACIVAAPAITVLAGLASVVGALATAGLTAWSILKAAGVVGSTVPKVPVSPGSGAAGGVLGRLFGRFGPGAAAMAGPSSSLSKSEQDRLHDRLGRWAQERENAGKPSTTWVDPPLRKSLNDLKETVERNTLIQKQSADQEWRGLIHKSAVSAAGTATSLRNDLSGIGSGFRSSPLAGSVGTAPLSDSAPGAPLNGGSGLSRRGILGSGGNPQVLSAPSGAIGDRMRGVYQSFRNAGLGHEAAKSFAAEIGRENDYNPNLLYGAHRDPHNGKLNAGMMSWQGDRATKLMEHLRSKGLVNPDGSIQRSQDALNAQAEFAMSEMKSGALGPRGQRALGVLTNPNSTHAQRALTLGDDVIKWRQHDPQYASHGQKRDRYYGQLGGLTDQAGPGRVSSEAVENARKLVGLGSSSAAQALGARMSPGQWCADFVNGALQSSGVKGVNSSIANSFLGWGRQVMDGVRSGDVLVEHRGRGQGAPGGHVGLATGESRMGPRGLQLEQISGNHGNRVARSWVDASRVAARRAVETTQNAAETAKTSTSIGEGLTSTGWKPAAAGGDLGTRAPLGSETPIRSGNTQPHGGIRPQGAAGTGGGSAPVIHVNGGNNDPQAIANAVQRRLQEENNRRTNDVDAYSM